MNRGLGVRLPLSTRGEYASHCQPKSWRWEHSRLYRWGSTRQSSVLAPKLSSESRPAFGVTTHIWRIQPWFRTAIFVEPWCRQASNGLNFCPGWHDVLWGRFWGDRGWMIGTEACSDQDTFSNILLSRILLYKYSELRAIAEGNAFMITTWPDRRTSHSYSYILPASLPWKALGPEAELSTTLFDRCGSYDDYKSLRWTRRRAIHHLLLGLDDFPRAISYYIAVFDWLSWSWRVSNYFPYIVIFARTRCDFLPSVSDPQPCAFA